jgi:formamidopyrimidine-DNA glycosylase
MPELPEVELTARNLRRWLAGEVVKAARFPSSRVLRGATPASLERLVVGRWVDAIERRGKWIALKFRGDGALYSHLGMTGKWVRRTAADGPEPHERARLDVAGASVRYRDPRLFGRLVASASGDPPPEWRALGPDPLVDGLPPKALGAAVAGVRRSIKEALIDQGRVAGLGNIQVQEALWRAEIDPRRPAGALDRGALSALSRAIKASIAHTLKFGQADELSYVEEPGAPNPFRVYGRAGEPCPRCGQRLQRIVQGGRSTVLCPKCQR